MLIMSDSGNEYKHLLPILPALLIVPILSIMGFESYDVAYLIILAPFLAFPTILIIGQIFNSTIIKTGNRKLFISI